MLLLAACGTGRSAVAPEPGCAAAERWLEPASQRALSESTVLDAAAAARIVLLGEEHDDADHHRWQLQVLSALRERKRPVVIAVEMLPRSTQPVLDRWNEGSLDEAAFLDAVRWKEIWGHDPKLYLPIFHFARNHHIPMLAVNVERSLVSRVAREGWTSLPAGERQDIGEPAPAAEAYWRALAGVFAEHAAPVGKGGAAGARLDRFIQAQLTWDRAMAEAIAAAAADRPDTMIVGIVGRGHVEHGWGIPHQLADLGAPAPAVLLPVGEGEACAAAPDLADAIFVLPGGASGGR